MVPNKIYQNKEDRFWALVKFVSETVGYSERKRNKKDDPKMKIYNTDDVLQSLNKLGIDNSYYFNGKKEPRAIAVDVVKYLNYRGKIIKEDIKDCLLTRDKAKKEYNKLKKKFAGSKIKIQMNKQKGDKKHPSYLVNMVNLNAESVVGSNNFNDDPMKMGLVLDDKGLLKTLCRRMDGAYPSTVSPKLLWEVKEYYGTTTFGSRIADGVYETMLVGEELKELHKNHNIKIFHVLFVDDYYTWWSLGRSYVCRLIDMMHMDYVDAIFFGKEAVTEWPKYLKRIKKITK